jgi:hypothetical protein
MPTPAQLKCNHSSLQEAANAIDSDVEEPIVRTCSATSDEARTTHAQTHVNQSLSFLGAPWVGGLVALTPVVVQRVLAPDLM